MNRKGDFSLMYEIVGLIIFAITSLIWFGGVESIIGGLTGDKAITAFNQLTGAIKSQCVAGADANPVTLTGLNLKSYGDTFIVTQLFIRPGMDADTMGFVQPAMRKCVGANCLCLLELNELEGNWQMCTTSDWDSYNFAVGGILGAPGCPFWYYAPPGIIDMSMQNLMDLLQLDVFQVAISALPWFNSDDPSEHFSYPAPELWGGCSNAKPVNLSITSFSDVHANFDCDSLSGLSLINYFDVNPLSELNAKVKINELPLSNINPFIEPTINSVPAKVDLIINDYFSNSVSYQYNHYLNSLKPFVDINGKQSLINNLKQSFASAISDVAGDHVNECVDLMIGNITDSFNDVYFIHDVISGSGSDSQMVYSNFEVNVSFTPKDLPDNIDGFNLSFVVKGDGLLKVSVSNCSEVITVNDDDWINVKVDFNPECIGEGVINFKEVNNDLEHVINIKLSDDDLPINTLLFNGVDSNSINDLLINITFDRKKSNELVDYAFSALVNKLIDESFINANDGAITSRQVYSDEVVNYLNSIDLTDYPSEINNLYEAGFNDYFSNLLTEKVYDTVNDECSQVNFPSRDIKFNAYDQVINNVVNGIDSYLLSKIGHPNLDVSFSHVNNIDDLNFSPISYYFDSFSRSFAEQQLPYIKKALSDCLEANDITDVDVDSYDVKLVDDYSSIISESLINHYDNDDLINALELSNNYVNLDSLPSSFSFDDNFNDFLLNNFKQDGEELLNSFSSLINNRILEVSDYLFNAVNKVVQTKWSDRPVFEVDCWPKVGGGYFQGYPAVNDLLGWRKYTSVSRLSPFLIGFELDLANRLIPWNAIVKKGFKKVDESFSMYTYVDVGSNNLAEDLHSATPSVETNFYMNSIVGTEKVDFATAQMYIDDGLITDASGNVMSRADLIPFSDLIGKFILFDNDFSSTNLLSGMGTASAAAAVAAKQGTKIAVKKAFKDVLKVWLKKALIKGLILTAVAIPQIAINMWKNTILTSFNADEVIYSSGGIRTFNPDLVEVRSCVRMDELGCAPSTTVWVNESFYCNTDLYVRRLVNPNTWFNYLKGNDACAFADDPSHTPTGVTYKDTLSVCYKLSCDTTGPVDSSNGDRYHVFQYWVGANTDPAGVLGKRLGSIDALRVYNASRLGSQFNNVIMLEVMGGNVSSKMPASIV